METNNSPPPCPTTVTVRRNPHRRARPTPSTVAPVPMPLSPSSISQNIPSFPIEEILSIQLPQNPNNDLSTSGSVSTSEPPPLSENLKVFLRIRPLAAPNGAQIIKKQNKNAWPQNPATKNAPRAKPKKKTEICISVTDSHSVTLSPPTSLQEVKRAKSEIFEGFSHVFSADSTQDEVFAKMVNPLVEDFLGGKCGMLAALGPSGSGKTHTVFGSPRQPGMIPLALRRIFSTTEAGETQLSRTFYLSMFEICSERGKAERILDLFQDVADLCMQQSTFKGLQEVTITNVQQAESLIGRGMLKRATASTNSNSQSSRSQCIINIRGSPHKTDEEVDLPSSSAVLTIVDLAGAEREKRTGNQGARLLESNFINNTSMVFGLCLRSLLEHQKNPKKPLQKHFQNSLLTRYLRDYLEGKKRMALILTVKSGVEDYLNTSFLLRQASPYMKIKFNNAEEPSDSLCKRRNIQPFPKIERLKRMKLSCTETCQTNGENGAGDEHRLLKEETLPPEIKEIKPENYSVHPEPTINVDVHDSTSLEEGSTELEKERKNMIMQNFARAMWKVLKQYKGKLEVAETQIQILHKSLANEKARSFELETELKDLKSNFLCEKEVPLKEGVESSNKRSVEQEGCQCTDDHELNAGLSSLKLESELITIEEGSDDANVNNAGVVLASSIAVEDFEKQGYQFTNQDPEDFSRNVDIAEDPKDKGIDDTQLDRNASDSRPSEYVVSSPKLLVGITTDSCSSVEEYRLHSEEDKFTNQEPEDFPRNVDIAEEPKEKGTDDTQLDRNASDSGPFECVVSSPKLLVGITTDSCSSVEEYQSHSEEDKERLDEPTMAEEGVEMAQRSDACSAESKPNNSSARALNAEKPKRRLLPASSILLKNISSLEFEDDYEKPKGGRGEKKLVPEQRNRTQGSISLLRLLKTNLHL